MENALYTEENEFGYEAFQSKQVNLRLFCHNCFYYIFWLQNSSMHCSS